jgi:hypothetical protein
MLKDPEWSAWSDIRIADQCCVSPPTVAKYRAECAPAHSKTFGVTRRAFKTKHGTTATMNTANIGARPAAPVVALPASDPAHDPEWYQTDIEDFAPTPQRVARFSPDQRSQAAHIRYFLGEIDRRLTLTPALAAAAFIGEIHSDAEQVSRVVSWLNRFQGELHAEMRRREGSEAG